MKTTKVLFFTLLFAAVLLPTGIKAQVTIGYDKAPEPFSVLELISGGDKGLRLPQLSTTAIDDLGEQIKTSLDANYKNLARGLIVYDSTLNCVKYWKGTDEVWVGIGCPSAPPLAPILADAQKVCGTTIADLEPSGLNWYAAETGGTALSGSTALVDGATYHASQTVSGVESTIRTAVTITLETNCAELSPTAYNIFSPVSVMYTYQYQDLELYKGVNTGGNATSFQWKVNRKNQATVVNIPAAKGGTAQTFRVPSNFGTVGSAWSAELNTLLGNVNKNDILIFTCEYTNPNTTTPQTVTTEIEFIKLDENNSVMFNGVKYYYVELDVPTSATSPDYSNSNGYLRILATNLGVENENAADIGDLYQWGRGGTADQTPDGHEHIVWGSTGTTSKTIDFATGTSGTQA
ncbi:MAG: hypothetical protein LBT04_01945, partial [Prevotellaceae bacterium]|nr:hypothetical protein [Prevotellaceae bacterium]